MTNFDYKGLSEEELLNLCDETKLDKGKCEWKYWTAEVYSFGKHIREYGFYPYIFPLYIYTDHGPGYLVNETFKHELEHDAYCQFYHSPRSVDLFKKVSNKHCYTMFSPFVFYRRNNKIEKLPNAKGTLVFSAHSTPDIDNLSNIEDYVIQLKALPEEFQPICACLHMHDINKGQHKIFMKHEIPIYTAGNALDFKFAKRFYNILKNFNYSTSNMIGSYTYYSVEMGIPFFIHGNKPLLINNADPNLKKGEYKFQEEEYYLKIYKMLKGPKTEITDEQKKYFETHLGIYDGISRFKMAQILYSAYFFKGGLKDSIFKCLKYIRRYPLFFLKKDFWKWLFYNDNL